VTGEPATELSDRISRALRKALAVWGTEAQVRMVQEECGELIAAINQRSRGRIDDAQLAGEVADVIIVLGFMRLLLGSKVDARLLEKLERLEQRLEIL
jgi:NTP pyrophosphatase (non-canonical NTP hydrolase)